MVSSSQSYYHISKTNCTDLQSAITAERKKFQGRMVSHFFCIFYKTGRLIHYYGILERMYLFCRHTSCIQLYIDFAIIKPLLKVHKS
jgi:hypothetical protein